MTAHTWVIMAPYPKPPRRPTPPQESIRENVLPSSCEGIGIHSLRTSVRNAKLTYSTWLDQDESGDYDPGADYQGREPKNQPRPALFGPASFEPTSFESTSFEDAPFEPAYRRDCTTCTRDRRVCPYREGGDRRKPCFHSARLNQRCVVPKPRARRGTKPLLAPEVEIGIICRFLSRKKITGEEEI